jgi:hypothetical protein
MSRTGILVAVLLLLASGASRAGPGDPFAEARERMVPGLLDLADWCRGEGLKRERARVLEAVLVFDPDHARARRELGYRRREGGWERRPGWREPRKTRIDGLADYLDRREALLGPFVGEVLSALEEPDASLVPERRGRVLDTLVRLAPEDERVRGARGEARLEERWVLLEALAARERLPRLRERATCLRREEEDPAEAPLDRVDRAIGLPWKGSFRNRFVRTVGTVTPDETREAARLAAAATKLFNEVFESSTRPGPGYVIHLLKGLGEAKPYLDRHPGISPARREFAAKLESDFADSGYDVGIWSDLRARREEWVARQTLAMLIRFRYGLSAKHGALSEGIGLHLSHLLTGRRSTWFVRPTEYAGDDGRLQAQMRDPKADWKALARRLIRAGQTPDYRLLLSLDVNAMTRRDLIHAHALAAYLIEGKPEGAWRFLRLVGHGRHPAEAAPEALGRTLPELEHRVRRWLEGG